MRIVGFIKDWILIFAIIAGVAGYFIYDAIPALDSTHEMALNVVSTLQPLLIFGMLFLTFSRVSPRKLRLCTYHWWLLLFQSGLYIALASVAIAVPAEASARVVLESAMICLICPTATAGAVITKKLGGDTAHIVTYTMLINLVAALIIPVSVPLIHSTAGMSAYTASILILGKVFPLLLLPLIAALLMRLLMPKVHYVVSRYTHVSFYLWVVALALAMAVTTRYIMHTSVGFGTQLWIVAVSFFCCFLQFWAGRKIGALYGDTVTAGQSLGQKNTVLAIWLGYTFYTPITALAGGFYSIWHNVVNSWQLYRHKKLSGPVD